MDFQSKLTILGNSLGIFPSLTLATYVGKRRDGMLRLSAEIPPGNCGSPVLNENGQLIGLLAGRVLEANEDTKDDLFSIALPIEEINSVITDFRTLLKDQKGWAGLSVVDMSNTEIKGVRIVHVVPNGPSAKAELCEGDTLVQFEGQWVENARQVAKWVKSRKPEEEVLFTVKKKGHFINRAVQLSYPVIYTKNIDN